MRTALSEGSRTAGRQSASAIAVWAMALAAICLDSMLAPGLNTLAPAFSCGLLLLLLVRRRCASSGIVRAATTPFPRKWRIAVFLLLHATCVAVARGYQSSLLALPASGLLSLTIATSKYLILFPTILLMPLAEWRVFGRACRAESLAAVLALLTVYPYRAFHALWPWYAQALGHAVYSLAWPVVDGLKLLPESSPVLAGPAFDLVVIQDCGGLEAIELFQVLFAVVLIADWNTLNKARTAVAYWLGMGAMLLANALRISLLVIVGNRFPQWVVRHHIVASWIFLTAALVVCLLAGYRRLFSAVAFPAGENGLLANPSRPSRQILTVTGATTLCAPLPEVTLDRQDDSTHRSCG